MILSIHVQNHMLFYWMIWYCYCFLTNFKRIYSCIVQYSLYHDMDICTMCHFTLVSSTPSQSIGLFFGRALVWCWVSLGALFTISFIEFYFIMIFIMIVTIIGIFMVINDFLNYTSRFLYLSNFGSANAQLPGYFCPWNFSLNIGLNMLPLDSFMLCLHSLLGYSRKTTFFFFLLFHILIPDTLFSFTLFSCLK